MLLSLLLSLLLSDPAFALHTRVFPPDPSLSPAPLAGLDLVVVDPSAARFEPVPEGMLSEAPGGAMEVYPNGAPAGDPALVFTNPLSSWAWIAVNGTKVGIVGPYATLRFEGFSPGWYSLSLTLPTGMVTRYAVEIEAG